jgi:DNA polymerase III subunit epsilon
MRYLVFDTETNGLPKDYKRPYTDVNNWPRIVQIAWTLGGFEEKMQFAFHAEPECRVIKPDGWTIPDSVAAVHGISTAKASQIGTHLGEVLDEFQWAVMHADVLVAHNVKFDRAVVACELLRAGRTQAAVAIALEVKSFCTMEAGTPLCRIPGPYGWKWPRLNELYRHLFNRDPENQHSADGDVEATACCYEELRRRGFA